MQKLRVLYVSSEIDPFLQVTKVAEIVRNTAQAMQEKGLEIRILVPRFGTINERKNRLHEVVRLSGINITVGDEEKPLIIKVASIPNAKLQVYFIDNDDYFHRKGIFSDPDTQEEFYADNDERAIFFCKGVLETVKKLGWSPDIIHCSDWMTGLIPMYLKTAYRKDPVFNQTKCIFNVYDNYFTHKFEADMPSKVNMHDVVEENLAHLYSTDCAGFLRTGMEFADMVVRAENSYQAEVQPLLDEFESRKEVIQVENLEEFFELYHNLYNELVTVS
jgi:starch synthase